MAPPPIQNVVHIQHSNQGHEWTSYYASSQLQLSPDQGHVHQVLTVLPWAQVDAKGNVYAGVSDGVSVYAPSGQLLGKINVGSVTNIVFAGDRLIMLQVSPREGPRSSFTRNESRRMPWLILRQKRGTLNSILTSHLPCCLTD